MKDYPKQIKLKDGTNVTIRPLEADDLDNLVKFFQTLPLEDRMYLKSDVMNRVNIEKRFGNVNSDLIYTLVVMSNSRIIAQGNISRDEFGWKRHLGEIRVVVAKEYQRLGLCTILTRELFLHALSTDLHKLQAEITEKQESALAAFEKMGFKKEAILRKHVSDISDNRTNLVVMSLDIEELWFLMEDVLSDRMYVT